VQTPPGRSLPPSGNGPHFRRAATIRERSTAVALFLCLAGFQVFALGSIDTDGPDFVESSEVVGEARFQYEANVMSERDHRNSSRVTRTSTPILLKYGITDAVEIRLESEGYIRTTGDSGNTVIRSTGTGDTALGVKWHSQDRDAAAGTPAVSWILHLEGPSGADGLRGHGIRPSLRSVMTWEFPYDLTLGLMPGIKYDAGEDSHRFTSGILGAVLNKRLTEKSRAFFEASATQLARGRDGGALADWNVGAAYLLSLEIQIGFRAGIAANRNTPNGFVLFELAQRY
jgi:hypothetical protein